MFKKGNYIMKCIYWNGKRSWLIKDCTKPRDYHTHVPFEKKNAAKMIVVRAFKGTIPEHYPHWMVVSINRLWYGKNSVLNKNENLQEHTKKEIKHHKKKDKYKNRLNKK